MLSEPPTFLTVPSFMSYPSESHAYNSKKYLHLGNCAGPTEMSMETPPLGAAALSGRVARAFHLGARASPGQSGICSPRFPALSS